MVILRRDASSPVSSRETEGGLFDLAFVEREELTGQLIRRGLTTSAGSVLHRPEDGAGIGDHQNEPPTTSAKQRLINQASRYLDSLSFVEEYRVTIANSAGVFILSAAVFVDGNELEIPEIRFV